MRTIRAKEFNVKLDEREDWGYRNTRALCVRGHEWADKVSHREHGIQVEEEASKCQDKKSSIR